jgi:hypothetical protein
MKPLVVIAGLSALLITTGAMASEAGVSKKKPQHKTGQYVGKTSEPAPILLLLSKKHVTAVGVNGRAKCTDPQTGETSTPRLKQQVEAAYFGQSGAWKINRKGRFAGTVKDPEQVRGENALSLRLKGRAKGRRVKGKVSYRLLTNKMSCNFGPRRFKAKWTGRDQYGRGPSGSGPSR